MCPENIRNHTSQEKVYTLVEEIISTRRSITEEYSDKMPKWEDILSNNCSFFRHNFLMESLPKLFSIEDLIGYTEHLIDSGIIMNDQSRDTIEEEIKQDIEEELKQKYEKKLEEIEQKYKSNSIFKQKVLDTLEHSCSKKAYNMLEPIIEQIFKK